MDDRKAPLSFNITEQLKDAREAAIEQLGLEKAARMSDNDIAEWIDENYFVFAAYNDEYTRGEYRMANGNSLVAVEKEAYRQLAGDHKVLSFER